MYSGSNGRLLAFSTVLKQVCLSARKDIVIKIVGDFKFDDPTGYQTRIRKIT